jgi:hypothetical protein
MCLYVNKSKTNALAKRLKKAGEKGLRFWKVYWWDYKDELVPYFQSSRMYLDEKNFVEATTPGILPKLFTEREQGEYPFRVDGGGIHVYTTKQKASFIGVNNTALVPVTGYYEDFIAAGNSRDAVFRRVQLDAEWVNKNLA